MRMRSLCVVCLLGLLVSSETGAAETKVVCFEEKARDMEALVKQRDHEGAELYARLHCWEIRPPARDPFRGTSKETPFPNLSAMKGKNIYFQTFVPRK